MSATDFRDRLRRLPSIPNRAWPLAADTAPKTPHELFRDWLEFAIDVGVPEPHAMTLSTVDADGAPDARVLILKDVDARGWHFATDTMSPKGRQLAAEPRVALTFYWPRLARQVRIRGVAVALADDVGRADFRARSVAARSVAMLGRQSQPLASSGELAASLTAAVARLVMEPQHAAPGWTVFAVAPSSAEFWQGDSRRQHLRLRYAQDGDGWQREALWP
ncbi:MAG: pyridoxine/pyridoxamine 5'-phosphate oxidase [Devosia sp.]